MGSLWWTVAHFPCCRRNGLQSLPPSALELSLTAFHILQLQKNKKVLRIVAIKASACYLIYKCPYTLYTAYILSIQAVFETEQQRTPLRWQCARMTRSLMKIAKIPARPSQQVRAGQGASPLRHRGGTRPSLCCKLHSRHSSTKNMSLEPSVNCNSPSLHPNSSL